MQLKASPKQDNKSVGERSEAIILARFIELGFHVWLPWGENHRADMIVEDDDGQFYKVQCKTCHVDGERLIFRAESINEHHRRGVRMNYRGQADYFAVYSPALKKTYLLPVDLVGTTSVCLRLHPTKNNQEKNVRWAKDYEL
jgi:PD-(D/E)XK nuclease superfamily protein